MKAGMRKALICLFLFRSALLAQTVAGTVVSTGGAALAGVGVTLWKADNQGEATGYSATTDASGNFRLQDVKDGVYVVDLQLAGFLSPYSGGPGNRPFAVENGVTTKRLRFEMMPEGRVSGRVLDGKGSPVPGSKVVLAAPYGLMTQDASGDDGEFLFDQMPPGSYTLMAAPPLGLKPPDAVDGQAFAWAPTFFGGVPFREGAAHIVVRSGGEVSELDVKLLAVPAHRIRGQVLDPAGAAAPEVTVELRDAADQDGMRSVTSKEDGSFEFLVTDRKWRLSAEADGSEAKLYADLNLQMAGKDLDNVVLRLSMAFSVHGSVRFDPPEGVKATGAILFTREGGVGGLGLGQVDAGGNFTADGIYPGDYTVSILPPVPAPGYYLDAIRVGDRETLARQVEILSESTPISIQFKAGGGTVQGTVEDCGGAYVLLLPQDPSMRRQGVVRRVQCAEGGCFEIASARPGDYYVLALGSGSPALIPPYDLDRDYLNQAVAVTVANNSAVKVDLKVIPPRWF
jgi:protocatechuate 3,4-dioxygenase beta subunit